MINGFIISVLSYSFPYSVYKFSTLDGLLRLIAVTISAVVSSLLLIYTLGLNKESQAKLVHNIKSFFKTNLVAKYKQHKK